MIILHIHRDRCFGVNFRPVNFRMGEKNKQIKKHKLEEPDSTTPTKKQKKVKSEAVKDAVEEPVEAPTPSKKSKKEKKVKEAQTVPEPEAKKAKKDKKKKQTDENEKAEVTPAKSLDNDYKPGALSALFGIKSEGASKTDDLFAKYGEGDSGFVDVPTVIVEKKPEVKEPKENTREKQRVNRKKDKDDRMAVDDKKKTIFVGNLPVDFTPRKLKKMFAECGEIDSTRIRGTIGNKETLSKKTAFLAGKLNENISSIMGYVKFTNEATVAKALEKNGVEVEGHKVRVDGCIGIRNYDRKCTVFVGGLPFESSDDDVIQWAEETIGPVDFVRVVRDKNTGYGKGVGFISFKESASVEKALALVAPKMGKNEIRIDKILKKNQKDKSEQQRRLQKKQTKKAEKRAGMRGGGGAKKSGGAPVNPLSRPSRKVQKEIIKRKKAAGPKSLMK